MRRPEIDTALQELKRHLEAGDLPTNQEEAVEILRAASAKANPEWTVPRLDDPAGMPKHYPDGTIRITLLAHQVIVNPSGAYRIVELHPPRQTFYESSSAAGIAFVDPDQ